MSKRYLVSLQFYVWSDNEEGAMYEAKRVQQELDLQTDLDVEIEMSDIKESNSKWNR
jgi:hypothetical protein